MKARTITEGVQLLGAVDWDRRIFDSLIPIPQGTTYNAYLVEGNEKTALIDTVDPSQSGTLLRQLEKVPRVDYVISNHAEPDHSGTIPQVLEKYPEARLLVTPKAQAMLGESFGIDAERFQTVASGETLSLGGKTLTFLHLPWVHWPETMVTYLAEDEILFSCDLFGSHYASNRTFAGRSPDVYLAAKQYYAEIMMPFRNHIARHLEKLAPHPIRTIAPSHGPVYDDVAFILDAYREWVLGSPKNFVALLSISMHGMTRKLADHLIAELTDRGISLMQYDLTTPEVEKIAIGLVDAGTIVFATPTVLAGPHPNAIYAAAIANLVKPKARFASVIGSMMWGTKVVERLTALLDNCTLELLEPVICKGAPGPDDYEAVTRLAATIQAKHRECGFE